MKFNSCWMVRLRAIVLAMVGITVFMACIPGVFLMGAAKEFRSGFLPGFLRFWNGILYCVRTGKLIPSSGVVQ